MCQIMEANQSLHAITNDLIFLMQKRPALSLIRSYVTIPTQEHEWQTTSI